MSKYNRMESNQGRGEVVTWTPPFIHSITHPLPSIGGGSGGGCLLLTNFKRNFKLSKNKSIEILRRFVKIKGLKTLLKSIIYLI